MIYQSHMLKKQRTTLIDRTILIYSLKPFFTWRHQMEAFSASQALCVENSPVTGEFPSQRPVKRSFDVFFDVQLNEWLSKEFEKPSRSLWSHCNDMLHADMFFENLFAVSIISQHRYDRYFKPFYSLFHISFLFIFQRQDHDCWWPGDARHMGMVLSAIDLIFLKYSSPSSKRFKFYTVIVFEFFWNYIVCLEYS